MNLPAQVPLAWGAHRGASIIAEQLSGNSSIHFKGYLGNNIVKFFDYTLASVGIKPNELKISIMIWLKLSKELMQDITRKFTTTFTCLF